MSAEEKRIQEEYRQLVLVRLQALPSDMEISIGSDSTLSKNELINHVEANDEIGKQMIEIEKEFFQALKDGALYKYNV